MKLYIDSVVTSEDTSIIVLSKGFPKLLMPSGMCGSNTKRCYVNPDEFMEYTLVNGNQEVDEFMKELGLFGKRISRNAAYAKILDLGFSRKTLEHCLNLYA